MVDYCSNRITIYEERIAYINENIVDEVIVLLKLDEAEDKERLWDDLGSLIMRTQPPSSETKATKGPAATHGKQLIKNLKKTHNQLMSLHYKNVSELSKENVLRKKLEITSLPPPPAQRCIYSDGHGIRLAQVEGQKDPIVYPFDKKLYDTLHHLNQMISDIQQASNELHAEKQPANKGKSSSKEYKEVVLQICQLYKNYTGKNPHATNSGGSLSPKKVNGDIIPLLQMLLNLTPYNNKTGEEALQKTVLRLSKDKENSHIWSDN